MKERKIRPIAENQTVANSNAVKHYKLIAIGVFVGLLGVFFRFTGTWAYINVFSNLLLTLGTVLCVKAVFNILK